MKAIIRARVSDKRQDSHETQVTPKSFLVTKQQETAIRKVITAAVAYQKVTGRKLGISGEVGELLAAKYLRLRLMKNNIEAGFDAYDRDGKKVQIKSRRSESGPIPKSSGRLGTFSKHPFDYTVFVILSDKYDVLEIWKAEYKALEALVQKHKRRNPTIHEFKKVGIRVYPKATRGAQATNPGR